ncbi:hypothetical protein CANCADRAFT_139511 [Tortispora caseinolytica NRRL Y-17796]|uniref:Uncharacterized protein n=1 Tax=Tortispora caseinolytica NRRL Y-17796 TaxID=767744 RepID=A0A1E4TCE0_9ASCO|nr:hypothetical protein CANCADRAFT_139511 [Tortispora caseinolytica NRRL Y-17796]
MNRSTRYWLTIMFKASSTLIGLETFAKEETILKLVTRVRIATLGSEVPCFAIPFSTLSQRKGHALGANVM